MSVVNIYNYLLNFKKRVCKPRAIAAVIRPANAKSTTTIIFNIKFADLPDTIMKSMMRPYAKIPAATMPNNQTDICVNNLAISRIV